MQKHIFASQFKQSLINKGVSEKARPYYHRYLEQWGQYLKMQKARHSEGGSDANSFDYPSAFRDWLSELGRIPDLQDFQIRQAADTVRLAHRDVLGQEWAATPDWGLWVYRGIYRWC